MGFWEWIVKRFIRHSRSILRPLKPEIKKVVVESINGVLDTSINEWVEHSKPPKDIESIVRNYADFLKENVDELIEERIDDVLEG